MCYDAWLQEQKLDHEVPLPPPHAAKVPSRLAPDPKALADAADLIAASKKPVIIAEYVGREPGGFHALVDLAETGGLPVYDVDSRLNFPTRHPLNMSMAKDVFRDADLVVCLDTRDWSGRRPSSRAPRGSAPRSCRPGQSGSTSASATSSSPAGRSTTSACITRTCASSPILRSPFRC